MFNTRPHWAYIHLKKYVVYAIPFTYMQHLHVKHQIDTSKQDK